MWSSLLFVLACSATLRVDARSLDCPPIECDWPNCPDGAIPETQPGDCCPSCPAASVPAPECAHITCGWPSCPDGAIPETKPGDCCPSCPAPAANPCSSIACGWPWPRCPGDAIPVTKPGDCCPSCPEPSEFDCSEIDCGETLCPDGAIPLPTTRSCCPICPVPEMPEIITTGICSTSPDLPCCKKTIETYKLLISPGTFLDLDYPECEADGYFSPRQCHPGLGVCHCVDRNGDEFVSAPWETPVEVIC